MSRLCNGVFFLSRCYLVTNTWRHVMLVELPIWELPTWLGFLNMNHWMWSADMSSKRRHSIRKYYDVRAHVNIVFTCVRTCLPWCRSWEKSHWIRCILLLEHSSPMMYHVLQNLDCCWQCDATKCSRHKVSPDTYILQAYLSPGLSHAVYV